MRPSRRMLPKALTFTVLVGLLAAGPAFGQYYDPALRSLDLESDVSRSPRLLGMGSLSLAVPDRYQRFTLWDFARNPVGACGDDSVATLEVRPGTGSASGAHLGATRAEREDLTGRATNMDFETFHRDGEGTAWGVVGGVRSVRADQIYSQETEARRTVSVPEAMPIMTGPFPYWGGGRLRYAVRMHFARERLEDEYRLMVRNPSGEFISLDGTQIDPPSLFNPTTFDVRRVGFGTAWSYPIGAHATLAAGYDVVTDRIQGQNSGAKSESQTSEKRPFGIAQGTFVGSLGRTFEYGFDDHHWNSSSQQNWFFSASAGVGAVPLVGRGKLLERKEQGNTFNGKVRWKLGGVRLAGQYWTSYARVTTDPPAASDASSLNRFLSNVYIRSGADSLVLPDSAVSNRVQDNAYGYGVGASWSSKRALLGVEYHWARSIHNQAIAGAGPKAVGSDVRAGFEYRLSDIITGRIGGGVLWNDPDEFQRENEQRGETGSLGISLRPSPARWVLDLGWSVTWTQSDYGDPLEHHSGRQDLQSVLRWEF